MTEFDEGQTVTTAWLGYGTSTSDTLLGFFLVCSGQNLSGVVQGGYSGDPTTGRREGEAHQGTWFHPGFEGHKVGGVKLASVGIVGMLLDKHSHDGMPDQCA